MNADERMMPADAGQVEMGLVMIGIAAGFVLSALLGGPITALVTMIVGLALFVGAQVAIRNKYSRLAQQAEATILERHVKTETDDYGRSWTRYWLVFQFDAAGEPITLKARVSDYLYQTLPPGTVCPVRYHAANARVALLAGESEG